MSPTQPEFLYVALILPSLFALTLIVEGLHKLLQRESGWTSLAFGIIFLLIILGTYFFVLR
ncbi:hypothetical protein HZB97_00695 [Candidatus Gottesmanbacteria bacterium]|nr:hypothetical protein [Candidatus Gottesmanbacteria bacterium]MBI5465315.1 hypothetical protein [Candidatus Gottesmanbacteria bacterium]